MVADVIVHFGIAMLLSYVGEHVQKNNNKQGNNRIGYFGTGNTGRAWFLLYFPQVKPVFKNHVKKNKCRYSHYSKNDSVDDEIFNNVFS